MDKLGAVISHLRDIGPDFYGEITIKIRAGRAVLVSENRTWKLDEEETEEEYGRPADQKHNVKRPREKPDQATQTGAR